MEDWTHQQLVEILSRLTTINSEVQTWPEQTEEDDLVSPLLDKFVEQFEKLLEAGQNLADMVDPER